MVKLSNSKDEKGDIDSKTLYELFTLRYLSKKEIKYRLPTGIQINDFWTKLLEYRMSNGYKVPLLDQKGNYFWFSIYLFQAN